MSDSYTSSSYYYSSSTNATDGSNTTGHRYTTTSHTDPDGNTIVRTAHQDLGQPAIIEERHYDRTGQEMLLPSAPEPGASSAGGVRRITDLDDESGIDTGESVSDEVQAGGAEGGEGETGLGRITFDSGSRTPGGGRAYDVINGAYDDRVDVDEVGAAEMRKQKERERHHRRVQGKYHDVGESGGSGNAYYSNEAGGSGRRTGFEEPDTGARVRRESDVEISDVI